MPSKKTGKRNKRDTLSQSHLPSVDSILPSLQTKAERVDADNRTDHCEEKQETAPNLLTFTGWLQIWLPIIFSGLVVVVIFAQAYIYKKQWNAMQDTLKEMRLSRELENRAWIGVKSLEFEQGEPAGVDVVATFVNSGASPAIMTFEYRMEDLEQSPADDIVLPPYPNQGSSLALFPHVERRARLAQHINITLPAKPKSPNHTYYIYGVIKYRDIFDQPHTTRFCYMVEKVEKFVVDGVARARYIVGVAPTHNGFD
jgi:hypothetical protein